MDDVGVVRLVVQRGVNEVVLAVLLDRHRDRHRRVAGVAARALTQEVLGDQELVVGGHHEVGRSLELGPFTGGESPIIQKAQFESCIGAGASNCTEQNFNPIGTGPFKVVEFRPNDVITMEANENYRGAAEGKPAFATLTFKGGGDATAAGRAVMETGEFDYAWNLQLAPPPKPQNPKTPIFSADRSKLRGEKRTARPN